MLEYLRAMIIVEVRDRISSERGASAVEYGLLVAAIAAVIVVLVFTLGGKLSSIFSDTCSKIGSTNTTAGTTGCAK
jgi:pilus assembly protein Flp/PilA